MRNRLTVLSNLEKTLLLGAVLLVGLVTLSYAGLALADQPDSKVLTVDNPNVACVSPVAGTKVEGELGRTITVSAEDPIDFVGLKSGVDVVVVSAQFDTNQGQITLSKDISNYVVWTCPPTTPTPPPTVTVPPTTSPPPTMTTGTPTSTTSAGATTVTSG